MEIRKWLENLKKEKTREKLVQAAQKLESKADPSLLKKTLPKNRAVKQEIIEVEKKLGLVKLESSMYIIEERFSKSVQKPNDSNR